MPNTPTYRSPYRLTLPVCFLLGLTGCSLDTAQDMGAATAASNHADDPGGFDWGASCSSGSGVFRQQIPHLATTTIGEIPTGKRNVRVELNSPSDVDIQLVDMTTGLEVIAWPNGLLNGSGQACVVYQGVEYCYSGYDGVDGEQGNEWIEVRGDTQRPLAMRAFGYAAGLADVSYSWSESPSCTEVGNGSFDQDVPFFDIVTIGTIPVDKVNVEIRLTAPNDIDIQLYDGDIAVVKWPDGLLNGSNQESVSYRGMNITWSGYNGVGGRQGHEFIRIDGRTSRELTMRAFGYAAGQAVVTYRWGLGVGASCGSAGLFPCGPALTCKNGEDGNVPTTPGTCHTELWCESDATAADDCSNALHPAIPGQWGCTDYGCDWRAASPPAYDCSQFVPDCDPGYVCEWSCPTANNCGFNPPGFCMKQCDLADDCATDEFCGLSGVCRPNGACITDHDCSVADNDWDLGTCIATHTAHGVCTDNQCATQCLPLDSNVCLDVSAIDLGLCEALWGWGYDATAGTCVAVSGCSDGGYDFYDSLSGCQAACP